MKKIESEFLSLSRNQTIKTIVFSVLSAVATAIYTWIGQNHFPSTQADLMAIWNNASHVGEITFLGFLISDSNGKVTLQSFIDLFKKIQNDQVQVEASNEPPLPEPNPVDKPKQQP